MSNADLFLKYNYPETKEMCVHFLTLVTAILAFTLSFAEKVFDFQNAGKRKRRLIISGWCLYLFSVIFCGLGLVVNSIAGGDAVYKQVNFQSLGEIAYMFIIFAGICFVLALLFTILAAITIKAVPE